MLNKKLEVGMFVKTKGARDGKGIRKVVQIQPSPSRHLATAIMQHYDTPWRGLNVPRKLVLTPYSSEVMLEKIVGVFTVVDESIVALHKCTIDPVTLIVTPIQRKSLS